MGYSGSKVDDTYSREKSHSMKANFDSYSPSRLFGFRNWSVTIRFLRPPRTSSKTFPKDLNMHISPIYVFRMSLLFYEQKFVSKESLRAGLLPLPRNVTSFVLGQNTGNFVGFYISLLV